MQQFMRNGAQPLVHLAAEDGAAVVHARLSDAGVTAAKRAVSVTFELRDVGDGELGLQWVADTAFPTGDVYHLFGATLYSGNQNDYVPVVIYGPIGDVTLPANVTKTTTNDGLVRGGTRTAYTNTVVAGNPESNTAVAEITDDKTGAANGRDLRIFGREYQARLLFSKTEGVRLDGSQLAPSLSMVFDDKGRGFLEVDCAASGVTAGRLTRMRRGRTTSWVAQALGSQDPGSVGADNVFCYGVPTLTVAAGAGARSRMQVLGQVNADLGRAVNATGANSGLIWTSGTGTIGAALPNHGRALAIAATSGNERNRSIYLLGRIHHN